MNNMILSDVPSIDRDFIRRHAKKIKAISYLGRFCKNCKQDLYGSPWDAAFHHKDPLLKDFSITKKMGKKCWEELECELKKCVLLCTKCHLKLHFYGERFIKYQDVIYNLSNSKTLYELYRRKATKEEIKEAKRLFSEGVPYKQIARRLKFKESTVRIWIPLDKFFDFTKPENEKLIIDLYDHQKKTMVELCDILHCTFRTIKREVLKLVGQGKISVYRRNITNQYSKCPRRVSINGIIYNNAMEASKSLKIGYSTICARIKRNKEGYKKIE